MREDDFQQRVLAVSRGTQDPQLYAKLFMEESSGNDYIPGVGEIVQPQSLDELQEFFDDWDPTEIFNDIEHLLNSQAPPES